MTQKVLQPKKPSNKDPKTGKVIEEDDLPWHPALLNLFDKSKKHLEGSLAYQKLKELKEQENKQKQDWIIDPFEDILNSSVSKKRPAKKRDAKYYERRFDLKKFVHEDKELNKSLDLVSLSDHKTLLEGFDQKPEESNEARKLTIKHRTLLAKHFKKNRVRSRSDCSNFNGGIASLDSRTLHLPVYVSNTDLANIRRKSIDKRTGSFKTESPKEGKGVMTELMDSLKGSKATPGTNVVEKSNALLKSFATKRLIRKQTDEKALKDINENTSIHSQSNDLSRSLEVDPSKKSLKDKKLSLKQLDKDKFQVVDRDSAAALKKFYDPLKTFRVNTPSHNKKNRTLKSLELSKKLNINEQELTLTLPSYYITDRFETQERVHTTQSAQVPTERFPGLSLLPIKESNEKRPRTTLSKVKRSDETVKHIEKCYSSHLHFFTFNENMTKKQYISSATSRKKSNTSRSPYKQNMIKSPSASSGLRIRTANTVTREEKKSSFGNSELSKLVDYGFENDTKGPKTANHTYSDSMFSPSSRFSKEKKFRISKTRGNDSKL